MDLKYVKELIVLLEKSGVQKITIKEKNGVEIMLDKGGVEVQSVPVVAPRTLQTIPNAPESQLPAISQDSIDGKVTDEPQLDPKKCVPSPMVGTFYTASSPEATPFVKVGDLVNKGDLICIVEAMKVMNEVKSDRQGKITKILVEDGAPVEYGQPLFSIE